MSKYKTVVSVELRVLYYSQIAEDWRPIGITLPNNLRECRARAEHYQREYPLYRYGFKVSRTTITTATKMLTLQSIAPK